MNHKILFTVYQLFHALQTGSGIYHVMLCGVTGTCYVKIFHFFTFYVSFFDTKLHEKLVFSKCVQMKKVFFTEEINRLPVR
jgi:hypothetical protein